MFSGLRWRSFPTLDGCNRKPSYLPIRLPHSSFRGIRMQHEVLCLQVFSSQKSTYVPSLPEAQVGSCTIEHAVTQGNHVQVHHLVTPQQTLTHPLSEQITKPREWTTELKMRYSISIANFDFQPGQSLR